MPQAYFTSPKRGQESPPGHRKSPRTHRSGRSSKITSPTPLSPKELANYILERGNNATSPIIAKMVLDQHLDSRALAEFADESDSEEQFTSLSVLGNKDLADDFLRTTSPLRHKLPPLDVSRSVRPSLMEIASLLEHAEFTAISPASTAPAFMTPLLSPSIPEWDLEDPNSPEDLEIFAPMQSAMDDSDDDDLLHSPGLRNFRVSGPPSSDDLRGVYSSLLRPAVPPFTPETMPLLSALDMHQPYGISPSSSQGGADGLGDPPGHIQADLLNRRRSPGEDGKAPRTSVTEEAQEPSAPRMSRATSKMSMFGTDSITQPHSRPSSCPPRADRPRIIIPDTFWQPLPRRPPPQRTYAEAGVQTEVIEVPVVVDQPASHSVEVVSDAEDTSYHDARSTHSTTESVRDTDEETDEFHDLSQSGGEEHTSAPNTPKPSSKSELPADVLTPRASNTPAAAKPVGLPVENLQVQRLKADHATASSSPVAPILTRTTSEPQRTTSKKAQKGLALDTKRVQSSAGSSSSQAPKSAPPQPAPTLHATKPSRNSSSKTNKTTNKFTATKAAISASRAPQTITAAKKVPDTAKANEKRSTAKEPLRTAHVPETSSSSTVTSEIATAHDAPTSDPISNAEPAVHPEVHVDDNSKASQESTIALVDVSETPAVPDKAESGEDKVPSKSNESEPLAAQVAISSVEPAKTDSPDTVDNSQESTQTTPTLPGDTEQADQQTDTDGEASRSKLGKGKEPDSSNASTPTPIAKAPLLVVATTGSGESTLADELSSEAQEQVNSALSSSILPDTTSSEGVSSSESAEEHADAEKRVVAVSEQSTTNQPPSASTTVDSTALKADTPDDAAATEDTSDPTKTSNTGDATSRTAPEQTTPEGFMHIQRSDTIEPFETIDKNEAQGAGEQAGDDDLGSPWTDQNVAASTVVVPTFETPEKPKESRDDAEVQMEAILENHKSTELSENVAQPEPMGDAASVEPSKQTQVDTPALEPLTSPLENTVIVQSSPRSSDDVASAQESQPTESAQSDQNSRLENPAISRVLATESLERDQSHSTDPQTEDGGDVSNADGGEDVNEKNLTKNQKKKRRRQEAAAKKAAEEEAAKKELEEKEEKRKAAEEAAAAALKEAEEAEAARKTEEGEAEKQRRAEEDALAKRKEVERVAALEAKKTADAEERKQATAADKQRLHQQQTRQASSGGSVRNAQISRQQGGPWQQHSPAIRTQPQVTTNPKSFKQDLEAGPNPSPVGSPRARSLLRAHSDIESQNRVVLGSLKERSESPSSTTSKDSSLIAGVASTAASFWDKLRR